MTKITAILILALLAGCTGLTGPREEFTIFALSPPAPARSQGAPLGWQLLIEEPRAGAMLDGVRIVVAPSGHERQVYKGARWSERVPALLQGQWLRAFEADGRLPGVARAGSGIRADFILASDLADFQATYRDGTPVADVQVHVRLIDPRDRRIAARRVFAAAVPSGGTEIAQVVEAFDAALAQINPALVDWVLQEGQRAIDSRVESTSP